MISEKMKLDVVKFMRSLLEEWDNNFGFLVRINFISVLYINEEIMSKKMVVDWILMIVGDSFLILVVEFVFKFLFIVGDNFVVILYLWSVYDMNMWNIIFCF